MGPIMPVGMASTGSSQNLTPIRDVSAGAVGADTTFAGAPSGASVGFGGTSAITDLFTAVSQLLKNVGGGVENDQTLRMLVMLIILLALLDNSQTNGGAASKTLSQLAGGGGRSQFVGVFSSSTTIEIQQTSTTFVAGTVDYASGSSAGDGSQSGGQIDLSV